MTTAGDRMHRHQPHDDVQWTIEDMIEATTSLRPIRSLLALAVLVMAPYPRAWAWSDHSLGTWPALEVLPEVANAPEVEAHTLHDFVNADPAGLAERLQAIEKRAQDTIPEYPPCPLALMFSGEDDFYPTDEARLAAFLRAIRVNPNIKTPLYLQSRPGAPDSGRPALYWQEVTTLKKSVTQSNTRYESLEEGEKVAALEVIATAGDEPDYGLDLGVWADNGTDYGAQYGFGNQPFGNPKLEYASQAPFHMGFYHEAGIVYAAAPFLKRTYPEYRILLFTELSRFAFKVGQDYWGWRFAGWALHYIQDLTQPYHARVLPGRSVAGMLFKNALGMLGIKKPIDNAVQLVTNRHLALENYQYHRLKDDLGANRADSPLIRSLGDQSSDGQYSPFTMKAVRDVISAEAEARSRKTDKILETTLPRRLVKDPNYIFEQTEPNINVVEELAVGHADAQALEDETSFLLGRFGIHSRQLVRYVLSEKE